jgi:hypothetical protein
MLSNWQKPGERLICGWLDTGKYIVSDPPICTSTIGGGVDICQGLQKALTSSYMRDMELSQRKLRPRRTPQEAREESILVLKTIT